MIEDEEAVLQDEGGGAMYQSCDGEQEVMIDGVGDESD